MKRKLFLVALSVVSVAGALRADITDRLDAEENLQDEALLVAIDGKTKDAKAAYHLNDEELKEFLSITSPAKKQDVARRDKWLKGLAKGDRWLSTKRDVLKKVEFEADSEDVSTPAHYVRYYGQYWPVIEAQYLVPYYGGYYWQPAYYYSPVVVATTVYVLYYQRRVVYYY